MLESPLRQLLKPSGKTCFISPERGFRRCPVRPQYILNPVKRALAARGESLAAFDERCIPTPPQRGCHVGGPGASGVAPPSNTPGILSRRALPAGRLARLGATPDFHHGLRHVLEVGCGTGHWLRLVGGSGIRVTGLDASARRLTYAKTRAPAAALAQGCAERLPWARE